MRMKSGRRASKLRSIYYCRSAMAVTHSCECGNRHRTRHLLNQEFMQALLLHFRQHGKKAIEKVARNQPAVYLKILALLVPREMKLEHGGGVKAMSDEQIEEALAALREMLAAARRQT